MFTAGIESFRRKIVFALYIEIMWPPARMIQLLLNFFTVQRWWWRSQWKIGLNTKVWCCFYHSFPLKDTTCSNQIQFKTIFCETIFQRFRIIPLLVNNISLKSCLNPFSTNVPSLNCLKTSENRRFSDVFRGCRKETLVKNGLINQ